MSEGLGGGLLEFAICLLMNSEDIRIIPALKHNLLLSSTAVPCCSRDRVQETEGSGSNGGKRLLIILL